MVLPFSYESLRKILELECKKGYSDSAVIGGLDKFIQKYSSQASSSISDPQALSFFNKLITCTNYASMEQSQRKKWAANILRFISQIESGHTASSPPKSTKSKITTKKPTSKVISSESIDAPAYRVRGISTALAKKFAKLGVETIRDLLYFFPHRHLDYSQRKSISQLVQGEEQTVIANVWQAKETRLGMRKGSEAVVGDDTGNIRIVWFNQPYIAKKLTTDSRLVISGKVTEFGGRLVFENPDWEFAEEGDLIHTGRLVPVYSLTHGLYQRQVRRVVKQVVDDWVGYVEDFLPYDSRERLKMLPLADAIYQAHYPEDQSKKDAARVRLAFDELILLQLGVLDKKRDWQESSPGSPFNIHNEIIDRFVNSLPFKLTAAQNRVLHEILADLQKAKPMSRLLQGEVGSGKTVVATAALITAAANGFQGAFMAPTEILAEQHYTNVCKLLSSIGQETGKGAMRSYSGFLERPLTIAQLIGDMKQLEKQGLHEHISNGKIDIAIGTHALIQRGVGFKKLGLAVIDEQHRFGVEQRSSLRQKGFNPHVLVMTATPIPRTLALTLYGDLDLSVIDELPPGRKTVKTKWLRPEQRESAYAFIRKKIGEGRQAFIICPLVEESEVLQAKAAVAEYERLANEVFPDLKLGLLHGRMSSDDKDSVMQSFRAGELQILVSTPVIEVGIDVPNATVMLIESADRFGLSQLHQFRGRVGRGQEQSYCMLIAEYPSEIGKARLDLIERTHNGFTLAEEDLKLRGPGEFFGTRQSGLPDLKMARLSDTALLELARKEAENLFSIDPQLKKPEHRLLSKELARVWHKGTAEWS